MVRIMGLTAFPATEGQVGPVLVEFWNGVRNDATVLSDERVRELGLSAAYSERRFVPKPTRAT